MFQIRGFGLTSKPKNDRAYAKYEFCRDEPCRLPPNSTPNYVSPKNERKSERMFRFWTRTCAIVSLEWVAPASRQLGWDGGADNDNNDTKLRRRRRRRK